MFGRWFGPKPVKTIADSKLHHIVRLTDERAVCTVAEASIETLGFVRFAGGEENFKKPMCSQCNKTIAYLNNLDTI